MSQPQELFTFWHGQYRVMFADHGPLRRDLKIQEHKESQRDGWYWDSCSMVPSGAVLDMFQKLWQAQPAGEVRHG